MLKRTVTGLILALVLVGFVLAGYFVSPIFVDMLVLIFLAGSVYEMRKSLSDAGYKMFVLPPIFVLLTAYPAFYLMQYYMGDGAKNVSAGLQGLLIVMLVGFMMCLTIFTFKPHSALPTLKADKTDKAQLPEADDSQVSAQNSETVDNSATEQLSAVANNSATDSTTEQVLTAENSAAGETNCVAQDSSIEGVAADDSSKSYGLKDLFANVFLLVYPMTFFLAAWVASYKYSALFAVVYAIAVPIIGGDMFAYFFGSLIGGKKLCPKISPKKTVAGGVGALVGATIASMIFWAVFECAGAHDPVFIQKCGYIPFIAHSVDGYLWKSALIYIAIGLVCGVASELGDLAASSIKRAIGIKDYGKIFPGHGGFLDRIDSVLYCLAALLIAFSIIYGY